MLQGKLQGAVQGKMPPKLQQDLQSICLGLAIAGTISLKPNYGTSIWLEFYNSEAEYGATLKLGRRLT